MLLTGDILLFVVSLWLTLFVRYLKIPGEEIFETHLAPFLMLSVMWIVVFYIAGLYDKHTVLLKSLLANRIINTQIINIIIAALIFWMFPFDIAPKTNLIIYLFISSGLLMWWRLRLFPQFSPKAEHRALLIADGQEAQELMTEENQNERYNFIFVRKRCRSSLLILEVNILKRYCRFFLR
jgi:FlaA1/EpsC-like NDP-sugar epimerase